jgi:hypothetical protein
MTDDFFPGVIVGAARRFFPVKMFAGAGFDFLVLPVLTARVFVAFAGSKEH